MNPDKQISQLREQLIASNTRDTAIIAAHVTYTTQIEQLLIAAQKKGEGVVIDPLVSASFPEAK